MCKHDVMNIQHVLCGLLSPDCKRHSRASGYSYAPSPGGDVEQPQLMCKYDVIHKTGNTSRHISRSTFFDDIIGAAAKQGL